MSAVRVFVIFGILFSCHIRAFDIRDANIEAPQIIDKYIGIFESHNVTTEDGYVLTLFRIPREKPRGVVLLEHPVMVESKIWLIQGNQSTAFLFWNAGYDVWLANNRGTLYSKNHTNLTTADPEYWDFSFHEIGLFDLPATINYVKHQTKVSKIIYVGHSMGTTSSFIYASMKPEEAQNSVDVFVSMAPSCYFTHYFEPSKITLRFMPFFKIITGKYSLLSHDAPYLRLLRTIPRNALTRDLFIAAMILAFGGKYGNMDHDIIDTAFFQWGSEVSWKIFEHYMQLIYGDGEFRMYDYGPEDNVKVYGQEKAPIYPVEKIKVPLFLIYGSGDIVNHPLDVELLWSKMSPEAKSYGKLEIPDYGHLDFHFAKDRINKVYNKIFDRLKKHEVNQKS